MALAAAFVRPFAGLLQYSFREGEVVKTGRNCCVSSKVLISGGSLVEAENAVAASTVGGKVAFNWANNSDDSGKAKTTDRAMVVHCPDGNYTVYTTTGATRSMGTQMLDVPKFSGKQVHTYLGFIAEDGQYIATSIYTGEVTVA